MAPKSRPMTDPLLVRPGARYTCFGDGVCCTDVHGLGPITKTELVRLQRIKPEAVGYDESFEDHMLRSAADGGCSFLLSDMRCGVHAELGADAKADTCRRFPLALVATPSGGRITTEHRCPCRTLGDRPELRAGDARESLLDATGELEIEHSVNRLRIDSQRKVEFSEWEAFEAPLLKKLAQGKSALSVLKTEPFPKLSRSDWEAEAMELIDGRDGSQFGLALGWFGETILAQFEARPPRYPWRPWAPAFDRAEARSPDAEKARAVVNDWVADEIWGLRWAERSFSSARAELATLVTIIESITDHLRRLGLRPDRAAAEALLIVEVVARSDFWEAIVARMKPSRH